MKPGSPRWHRAAIGGTASYATASLPLLVLTATDETPEALTYASWIMTIIGMLMISALFTRLHYLKSADQRAEANANAPKDKKAAKRAATLKQDRAQWRRQLALFGWINIAVFSVWGLIWVFPVYFQCLIQNLMLGRPLGAECVS